MQLSNSHAVLGILGQPHGAPLVRRAPAVQMQDTFRIRWYSRDFTLQKYLPLEQLVDISDELLIKLQKEIS